MLRRILLLFACVLCGLPLLHAAGPRWVSSRPPWNNDGAPIVWYQNNVSYRTDAGPLSSSVNNAAAIKIVDAAAQVWNIQYSQLVLSNGGSLNEDVSSANVYLGSNGPIWPADVDSSNYTSVQIAVLFDADGTLIDLLLGQGASDPSSCRQNAAVEDVDKFIQPGAIAHAIVLLNGRCTGPAPEQQLQLQYQLMRVFGRVIGLAWSQVNDNVFTGATDPTYQQQLHWPIMHPIDIICGTYTYQCLPNAFTLRDDDRCGVRLLYGGSPYQTTDGQMLLGSLYFPTGEGMDGVNMVAVRQAQNGITESWQTTSAVTGYIYRRSSGNPVSGAVTQFPALQGTSYFGHQGEWEMAGVPAFPNTAWNNVFVTPETVNPLYRGSYSVGPTANGTIVPSGTPATLAFEQVSRWGVAGINLTMPGAAANCATGNDGTETSPAQVTAGGIWSGRICAYGHTSWGSATVQAGRTATLEVMALDETGAASSNKLQPVLGFWKGTDATGTLPTLSAAATPFSGRQAGTTQLTTAFSASGTVRFVVADARGFGRPDFGYSARLLYADAVSPSRVGEAGGTIHITGMGFEPGNVVTVGGVAASITSLTSTDIFATAPSLQAVNGATTDDVTVTDLRTGGTSTIAGGLLYGSVSGDVLTVVQAPPASLAVGSPGVFRVQLTASTGTAEPNVTVTFRVASGSGTLAPCGAATCTVATDNSGMAQVSATGTAAGSVALLATTASGAQASVTFTATATAQSATAVRPVEYVAAVAGAPFQPELVLTLNGARATGVAVQWTVQSGAVTLGSTQSTSAADGTAAVTAVGNLSAGAQAVLRGCAWGTVCTTVTMIGVSPDALAVQGVSGDAQVVSRGTSLSTLVLRVTDGAQHGVAGAAVAIHQAVTGWQPVCPATGRCATPPVYGTASTSSTSDDDGLVTAAPLQYAGTAANTAIVASTGTNGYFAVTLSKTP